MSWDLSLYRADITGLDIRSLTLTDSNSRLGGNTGYASGFDIDAIVISRTLITYAASAAALNGGVLPRLDVFDFSNASLDFTAGTQRDRFAFLRTIAGNNDSAGLRINQDAVAFDKAAHGQGL